MRRRQVLRALAASAAIAVMVGAGTAGAQGLPEPKLPATPVPVPAVPSVPVPDLPPAPAPKPPPAPAPPRPSVPAPSVPSAPSTPSAPPTPSTPSVPSAPSQPSTPSVPSAPSVPSTALKPSAPSAPSKAAAPSTRSAPSSASAGAAPGGQADASGGPAASSGQASATRQHAARIGTAAPQRGGAGQGEDEPARGDGGRREGKRAARDRRLRTTVARLAGCLGGLATAQRRVLVLRAGLGPAEPLSRPQVSGRLDVPVRRVVRIERRGLRRLAQLGRAGGCDSAPGGAAVTDAVSGQAAPLRLIADGTGSDESRPSGGGSERQGTASEDARSGVPDGFAEGGASDPRPAVVSPPGGGPSGTDLSWVALVLGLGLAALAVRRERRRTA